MRDDCIVAVEQALGRPLSKGEQDDIESAVNKQMRLLARKDRDAWLGMSKQEQLDAGAKAAADSMIYDVQRKQQLVRLTIAAHDRIENAINDSLDRVPEKKFKAGVRGRIVSQLLDFDVKAKGMQMSVASWAKSIRDEAMGNMLDMWEAHGGKFLGMFEDPKFVSDTYKELYNEESDNPLAKQAVAAWFKVTDELRDRGNKAGMTIGDLGDDYHKPQNHSQGAVAKAGVDKWIDDTLPTLDRSKYLHEDGSYKSDDDMKEFLGYAYDSIITKGFIDTAGERVGASKTADRQTAHRALFFKDADSALKYDSQYGDKNLWDTMKNHVYRMSRDIALNEQLGPDADKTFKYFNDRAALDDIRQFPENQGKIKKQQLFNERLYKNVSGTEPIADQALADASQAYRNWKVATSLPMVAATALGDEAGMAATAFANRVPYTDAAARQFKYLNPANTEDRAAAAHAGLGLGTILGDTNRFMADDFGGSGKGKAGKSAAFTGKVAANVMKYSGAEPLWDSRRRALGSVLQSYIGKMAAEHENFSDLNRDDAGVLLNKGVTENDWQVWKHGKTQDWGYGANTVLTPAAIHAIPDADIAHLGNPTALRRHAATMLLGHVLEETGMGVMDTGPRQRLAMALGTQKGTYGGELIRALGLFKGFSVAMMSKHWQRAAEMEEGRARYMATIAVGGTALAALAIQLRNLAAGRDPQNMADPKFAGQAALRGGGMGYIGDFFYEEVNSRDENPLIAVAGPLASDVNNVWNLTAGAAIKHAKGEKTDLASKYVRFGRDQLPWLNMIYTKAAADHLFFNALQESINPGYINRMQQRAQSNFGNGNWWEPHDALPARAPDFSKAVDLDAGKEALDSELDKVKRTFE